MDKHTLSYYLLQDIDSDEFLQRKYNELLEVYTKSLFFNNKKKYDNEYRRLLRYADILSLSDQEKHQNLAQQIAILLANLFPDEAEIDYFKRNIYTNVSNFVSASINRNEEKFRGDDVIRDLEVEVHKIGNNIPDTNKQFFDTQRIALNGIENNQFYSFSAPTSMGKTFVITNFIRNKIKNGSKENFVVIVPTRALLSEIANKIIEEFADILGEGKHKVITTISSLQNDENFIAVLTPERLYYALLKQPKIVFDYIFIDEAHKISDKDKRSIIYYKILDMLKICKNIHIYFSSPVIPNPDVYLELTNYYVFSDKHAKGEKFEFSPVVQNKICIDFFNREISVVNNLSKEFVSCGNLPLNINDKIKALLSIGKNKRNLIYVSSTQKAINYAMQLSNMDLVHDNDEGKDELEKVAKLIEQKINKEYFLANMIRKRVAYHIGALPAEIRSSIENLIRKGFVRFCFCTSTLLEGVNVPVDNLFIFDNKKARETMSEVDAFNLMGRAGRVTLNEYGNVFVFIENSTTKSYYNNIFLKPLPKQTLLPSKALKQSSKRYIVDILLEGRTNLLLEGEKYSDRGFNEVTYEYATKCLNMLLHDICNQNDSYIVQDFRKDKLLSPQNIIDIRNKFSAVVDKDDDINLSARQKESLYKAVREKNLNYPKTFDYTVCLNFLEQLSSILEWNIYEKDSLGKGNSIRYYTVILTQWMQSNGLHEIIRGAIEHYQQRGGSLVSYEPEYHLEPYNNSLKHKNQIINEAMINLDYVINYKLSMYFLRLSEAIVKIKGKDALENDWYEYVEYGTCNKDVILLQKYGFLREDALLLLKPDFNTYIRTENLSVKISNKIFQIVFGSLHENLRLVKINYPEIFED